MSDPFIPSSSGSGSNRRPGGFTEGEVQRLMRENKELRQRTVQLQLQLETASASSNTGGGGGLVREPAVKPRGRKQRSSSIEARTVTLVVDDNDDSGSNDDVASLRRALARESAARKAAERQLQSSGGGGSAGSGGSDGGGGMKFVALTQQFEAYVNASCEREQAYRLVYAGLSARSAERLLLTEQLQSQLRDMRLAHAAALAEATANATDSNGNLNNGNTASSGGSEAVPGATSAAEVRRLRARVAALEKKLRSVSTTAGTEGHLAKRQRANKADGAQGKEGGDEDDDDADCDSIAEDLVAPATPTTAQRRGPLKLFEETRRPTTDAIVIPVGAAAMREEAAAAAALADRRPGRARAGIGRAAAAAAAAAAAVTSVALGQAPPGTVPVRRRGRPRKKAKGDDGDETASMASSTLRGAFGADGGVSLFHRFTAAAAAAGGATATRTVRGGGGAAAASQGGVPASPETVHFSADSIGDFLGLMEETQLRDHRAVLARQLLRHHSTSNSDGGVAAVARLAVERYSRYNSSSGSGTSASPSPFPPLTRLWQETAHLLSIDSRIFPALCEAAGTFLVRAVGPDAHPVAAADPQQRRRSLDGLRAVAAVLRLAHVHHTAGVGAAAEAEDGAAAVLAASRAALVGTFLDVAVGTLRVWRFGHPSSPHTAVEVEASAGDSTNSKGKGNCAAAGHFALSQFCAIAAGLWGGGGEWADLARYHTSVRRVCGALSLVPPQPLVTGAVHGSGSDGAAAAATPSLALYAVQALIPLCLVDSTAGRDAWLELCGAVGWSESQIPLQSLTEAALRTAARETAAATTGGNNGYDSHDGSSGGGGSADAILCLRLINLYKGFSHLQTVMEGLRSSSSRTATAGDGRVRSDAQGSGPSSSALSPTSSSKVLDGVFAKLVSYAVADLDLQDTRDEQWRRTTAFLHDFLAAAGPAEFCSAEEFAWSAREVHLLAVRALVGMAAGHFTAPVSGEGSGTGSGSSEEEARRTAEGYAAAAMAWVAGQRAALAAATAAGRAPPTHPLTGTALGRSLLSALPPLTAG